MATTLSTAMLPIALLAGGPGRTDSLLQALQRASSDSASVEIMILLSQAYSLTEMDKAVAYCQQAVWKAENPTSAGMLPAALDNAMRICFRTGLADQAAAFLSRHLALMEEKGDLVAIADGCFNMGSIWLMIGNYSEAEAAFQQWLQHQRHLPPDRGSAMKMLEYHNNMGLIKAGLQKLDEAGRHYEQGIALARETPGVEEATLLRLLQNQGELLVRQGKHEEAFIPLEAVLAVFEENGNKPGAGIALFSLGNAYRGLGDTKQALASYRRAYQLSSQSGNLTNLAVVSDAIYKLYEETGPADSVLRYLSLYNRHVEEVKEEEAIIALTRQGLLSKFRERAKEGQARQRRVQLAYLLLLLGLLATGGWLYFKTHRRLQQANLAKVDMGAATRRLELEKELLQSKVEQKSKELTVNLIHAIQKDERIGSVVKKLQEQKRSNITAGQHALGTVIRELEHSRDEKAWDEFDVSFMQVHADFYKKLNQVNPNLTANDRRMCALLLLNMSSKEISSVTGQTPETIKVARTRLRRKLNLTNSEVSLVAFLSEI